MLLHEIDKMPNLIQCQVLQLVFASTSIAFVSKIRSTYLQSRICLQDCLICKITYNFARIGFSVIFKCIGTPDRSTSYIFSVKNCAGISSRFKVFNHRGIDCFELCSCSCVNATCAGKLEYSFACMHVTLLKRS